MTNNKIAVLGADGYINQIPRIKEGLRELGYIISKQSPSLIYANDPRGYEEALILKKKAYLFVDGRYTLQAKKESNKNSEKLNTNTEREALTIN